LEANKSTTIDLFGNVVFDEPRTKGRPAFERTDENAHKISMLLAMGWANTRIAGVVRDPRTGKSISVPTLKRHFRAELKIRDFARDQLVSRQLMRLWGAAEGGNVGAERLFEKMVEKNDLMLGVRKLDAEIETVVSKPVGQKQISANAAVDAERELEAELNIAQGAVRDRIN
jgi:hypothetical protein